MASLNIEQHGRAPLTLNSQSAILWTVRFLMIIERTLNPVAYVEGADRSAVSALA